MKDDNKELMDLAQSVGKHLAAKTMLTAASFGKTKWIEIPLEGTPFRVRIYRKKGVRA